MTARLIVGTAGWSLPRAEQYAFPNGASHLERYARVFAGAEINASFHRPLRTELYAKWAAAVPPGFRFSVKVLKTITHELRLLECEEALATFLDQSSGLGEKLGCLLVQLPPSLEYDESLAGAFFAVLRALHDGHVALEPRHATWFTPAAEALLGEYGIARAAADPARVPAAAVPGGAKDVIYYRLHGSPRVYWSSYDEPYIETLAADIARATRDASDVWCVFDNTASGAAVANALSLTSQIDAGRSAR